MYAAAWSAREKWDGVYGGWLTDVDAHEIEKAIAIVTANFSIKQSSGLARLLSPALETEQSQSERLPFTDKQRPTKW